MMMTVIITLLSSYYVPGIVLTALDTLTHGAIIMPISQIKKPRQRTTEHLVQDHKAHELAWLGSKVRPSDSSGRVFHTHTRCG